MFNVSFKEDLWVLQGCFKDASRVFQGCFKDGSRMFQGCFKGASRMFHACLCLKGWLRVFNRYFGVFPKSFNGKVPGML